MSNLALTALGDAVRAVAVSKDGQTIATATGLFVAIDRSKFGARD